MPTREQVLRLLESGLDYQAAGKALGVPAGQAYLIATGRPAEGNGPLRTTGDGRPQPRSASGLPPPGPPVRNPTARETVEEWLGRRVRADAQMRRAARQREAAGSA